MNIEEYLKKFDSVTKDPSLDAMEFFMKEFNEPQKKTKFIHVAGTNGKGSVCEMINNILVNAGYTVGKYISPHLIRYNERITVNNQEITDDEMSDILEKIDKKVEIYNKEHKIPVKEFEIVTTLALIYFAEKKCDFVVLETGLGGIYDCTNIVDGMISIITNIGLDHIDILGNTIEEIAQNKAGIIKPNHDTIMCYQGDVTKVFEETCKEKNNELYLLYDRNITNYSFNEEYQRFNYKRHENIKINLKGKCQTCNAIMALRCTDILNRKGYEIKEEAIKKGLSTVIHKARFETLSDFPKIIFDGGHNEGAINNLMETTKMYYPDKQKVYLLSSLKTKDYKTVVKILTEDKDGIFFFTTGNDPKRYVNKEDLYNEAEKYLNKDIYKEELKNAIKIAKEKYQDKVIMVIR